MDTYTQSLLQQFKGAFSFPEPGCARSLDGGAIGLVELGTDCFGYDRGVGYAFETAVMAEAGGDGRLFFVRIDSWDPVYRRDALQGQIDYCIPMAYDGASERERLTWKVPFGGGWSDCREEALLVFDDRWRDWLASHRERLAFGNPKGESAALFELAERDRKKLEVFLAGPP